MLWKYPIYRFRVPKEENEESDKLKELVIDVTGSAPNFKEPSENLKAVLNDIFADSTLESIKTVLEFGAAHLKNVPFILNKDKKVCACDFEKLKSSALTKKHLKKCAKYGAQFEEMVFPYPFINLDKKFDLALLINVVPVMPVFAERLFLLDLLHDKLNKYLLWVAQKEGSYKAIRESGKYVCGDGVWMGKNRYSKTFYKYHSVEDVDEMMALYGFERVKKFPVGDDAILYKKIKHAPFKGLVTAQKVRENVPVDLTIKDMEDPEPKIVQKSTRTKPVLPNPRPLTIQSLYAEAFKQIPEGSKQHAEAYHRLASWALARIFRGSLRNMEIKQSVEDGVKIIDTVFTNCAENGFFKSLQSKVPSTHPIIEVKNISGDPDNTDLNQLNGRFSDTRGKFGILVCRKVQDKAAVIKRCKSFGEDKVIIVLTDADIIQLLEHAREWNKEEINDFMDKKLKEIIF